MLNRRRTASTLRIVVEVMEPRRLLAAVSWDGGGGNALWNNPLNWSNDAVPTANDDVAIPSGVSDLRINAPGAQAKSVNASSFIAFDTGQALATDALTLSTGGTLIGGTLQTVSAAGTIKAVSSSASGLNGMTVESNWVMTGQLNIHNGLTLNGVMTAGSTATGLIGVLAFVGNDESFGGTGRLELGQNFSRVCLNNWPNATRRLVIESGLTIRTTAGTEWYIDVESPGTASEIVNHARLESLVPGGTLVLGRGTSSTQPERFSGTGTIHIGNGGRVRAHAIFATTGSIRIADGDLYLFDRVAASVVNLVERTGPGVTAVGGSVDLTGGPLNLTATTGSVELRLAATALGPGTINTSGGAQLICNPGGAGTPSVLSNVTINGTVRLASGRTRVAGNVTLAGTLIGNGVASRLMFDSGAALVATDGARLSNLQLGGTISVNDDNARLFVDGGLQSGTVRLNGIGARAVADGSQAWTAVTTSFLKSGTALAIKGNAAAFTLGAGSLVGNGSGSIVDDASNVQPAALVNEGTIRAAVGRTVAVTLPGGVTNAGTLQTDSGATLTLGASLAQGAAGTIVLNGGSFGSSSPINVTGGSYVVRAGVYTFDAAAFVSTSPLNVIVESTGRLTFADAATVTASLTVRQTGQASIASGGRVLRTGAAAVLDSARLDVSDGVVIVDYDPTAATSPLDALRARLASGYNGGTWDGVGIISSAAAATPGTSVGIAESADLFDSFPATFAGQTVDATSVLLRYTLTGDALLDQSVNDADYAVLQANFGQSPRRFSQGDFNFDGVVNDADRDLLVAQFGKTLSSTVGSIAGRVFDDVNGNGTFDAGEAGIAGRAVFLDVDGDDAHDPGEPTRTTDEAGLYAFGALSSGSFAVRQVIPSGGQQTAPSGAGHDVALVPGQHVGDADFGTVTLAPAVTGLFVAGTQWSQSFRGFVQQSALGESAVGVAVDPAAAPDELPWTNLNQISIRFARDVVVDRQHLTVGGINIASYALTLFNYNPSTFTATFTLDTAGIGNDKLALTLAGVTDAATGAPLAAPMQFRLNVLPGDASRNGGTVNAGDVTQVRNRQFTDTANPGVSPNTYSVFHDVNGNGLINAQDVTLTRNRQFTGLPDGEPPAMILGIPAATRSALALRTTRASELEVESAEMAK